MPDVGIQCHLLYLLLVRATSHLAPPMNLEYLLGWRKKLLFPRPIKLPIDDEMVQRWLIVSGRAVLVDYALIVVHRKSAM